MQEDDGKTALELVQSLMDMIDADIAYIEQKSTVYNDQLDKFLTGSAPEPISMTDPVKVEDAIFLPELGGYMAINPEFSIPSRTHAVKTLRNAIASGKLRVEKPNSKNQFLTRNFLQEYRELCQDQSNLPALTSAANAATPKVTSRTKPSGASMIEAKELTQASARKTLSSLKRR